MWPSTARRLAMPIALSGAIVALTGCNAGDNLEPVTRKPPYIAIVVKAETALIASPGATFTYRIKGLSTGSSYDSLVTVPPTDTVIVSVEPGTYEITLANLPEKCISRYGVTQEVVLSPGTNTAIARFFLSCNLPLAVRIYTAGLFADPEFVWQIEAESGGGGNGYQQTGIIRRQEETLIFPALSPGNYVVSLWNAPASCVFTNNGGRRQRVSVEPVGGARLGFSVVCSKIANQPKIVDFRWRRTDSTVVFIAQAEDPDYNISVYYFDLTDCDRQSVLPGGARERVGMHLGRTRFVLRPTIIGAFEFDLAPEAYLGRCASLRIQDTDGNTSTVEERLASLPVGSPPEASTFNAVLRSNELLATSLTATDRDDDFFGTFVAASLRDGTLGSPDGRQDIGIYNSAGYEGTTIPDLTLGNRILHTDVYAIMVYLVDLKGNFRKYVDGDTFH